MLRLIAHFIVLNYGLIIAFEDLYLLFGHRVEDDVFQRRNRDDFRATAPVLFDAQHAFIRSDVPFQGKEPLLACASGLLFSRPDLHPNPWLRLSMTANKAAARHCGAAPDSGHDAPERVYTRSVFVHDDKRVHQKMEFSCGGGFL